MMSMKLRRELHKAQEEPKVDRRRMKKHPDYGYCIVQNGLIHYYDKNKNYETTKFYTGNKK